jgi:integrase
MLTGQRVEEIARLHVDQWDARERIIDWTKTKTSSRTLFRCPRWLPN